MTSMQAEYQKMLNSQKQQAKTEHSNSEAEKDRIRKQKEAERKRADSDRKADKKRLMSLSEKELMVELILEMKSVHTICNRIERKCYEIEDNQKKKCF